MKKAFAKALRDAMADKAVWLLYADLGYGLWGEIAGRWPGRCLNAGVAEQNMVGVAAGLASCGKAVFVYSIAPFVTLRCLEQIRNDVLLPGRAVKIVGACGERYRQLGPSHYTEDDIAVMAALGMPVILARDESRAARAVADALAMRGPCYIRLG